MRAGKQWSERANHFFHNSHSSEKRLFYCFKLGTAMKYGANKKLIAKSTVVILKHLQ
jgi:hypothetical protein